MSATTTKLMTADELLVLPHTDERGDFRCELIRGELKKMSPTKPDHGVITAALTIKVGVFVEEHDLGVVFGAETGFFVERDPDTVRGADVSFVTHERMQTIENMEKFVPFAPDLAVEVLSPDNTRREMDEKVAHYFAAGSRLVWIVNPKRRTIAVYTSPTEVKTLREGETLDGDAVLPGFRYELAKLFAPLDKFKRD